MKMAVAKGPNKKRVVVPQVKLISHMNEQGFVQEINDALAEGYSLEGSHSWALHSGWSQVVSKKTTLYKDYDNG
jgi:hypothetical protein